MVYNNRFVVSIRVNGVFLEELANGTVPIPLNSEYTIRLRNKHNRRAVAKITIDGENVSDGGFVVPANGYVDIERPANVAKNFKFVSLTSGEAIDFGKNGPNYDKQKGLIEVHFHLEKERNYWQVYPSVLYNGPQNSMGNSRYGTRHMVSNTSGDSPTFSNASLNTKGMLRGRAVSAAGSPVMDEVKCSASLSSTLGAPVDADLKDGCTVEGDDSSQRFTTAHVDYETDFTTVKLFLQGFDATEHTPILHEEEYVDVIIREKSKKKRLEISPVSDKLKFVQDEVAELELRIAQAKKKKLEKELEELEK